MKRFWCVQGLGKLGKLPTVKNWFKLVDAIGGFPIRLQVEGAFSRVELGIDTHGRTPLHPARAAQAQLVPEVCVKVH